MATIRSLKHSYLELCPEARFALIRDNRALRRELKPKPVRKSKATAAVAKKAPSLDAMLAAMSPQQAKELLNKLTQERSS